MGWADLLARGEVALVEQRILQKYVHGVTGRPMKLSMVPRSMASQPCNEHPNANPSKIDSKKSCPPKLTTTTRIRQSPGAPAEVQGLAPPPSGSVP